MSYGTDHGGQWRRGAEMVDLVSKARSPQIYRSSNRPSSSWSSISRPPKRLASRSQKLFVTRRRGHRIRMRFAAVHESLLTRSRHKKASAVQLLSGGKRT